tara:strand:+ start:558 stop:1286 length:729 start_codon:yes stop_codon:yes gene_type:complete
MKKLLFLFVVLITFFGCKKEEVIEENQSPSFQPEIIDLNAFASTASLQENAPQALVYLQQVTGWMSLPSQLMAIPENYEYIENARMGGGGDMQTYTWNYMGYSVIYTYGVEGSQYVFDYTCSVDGELYYEVSGWQYTDGSGGYWEWNSYLSAIYENMGLEFDEDMDYQGVFEWSYNNSYYEFNYSFDFMNYDYDMEGLIGPSSGEYYYYLNDALMYECSWTLSSGYFIMYDGKGGVTYEVNW